MTASTRTVATLIRDYARYTKQVNDTLHGWGFADMNDAIGFLRGEEEATAIGHLTTLNQELDQARHNGWRAPQRNRSAA